MSIPNSSQKRYLMPDDLLHYTQSSGIKNQKILLTDHKLIINTSPLNFNIIADYSLLLLCIFLTLKIENNRESILLTLVLWVIAISCIWKDLRYANITVINLEEQKITIRSRMLIKKIFKKKKVYEFSEIDSFYHDSINLLNRGVPRYTICIKLKNGISLKLTDFSKQIHSIAVTSYLNSILN